MKRDTSVNQYAKDVSKLMRRIEVIHPVQALDVEDVEYVCAVLVARRELLKDLVPGQIASSSFWRDVCSLTRIDIQAYTLDFKLIAQTLRDIAEKGIWHDTISYTTFKQLCEHEIHNKWILRSFSSFFPIRFVADYSAAYQWACLDSKMNLRHLDLSDEMYEEYIKDEGDMRKWSYIGVRRIAEILQEWLSDFDLTEFSPRHGPGDVAGPNRKPSLAEKCQMFDYDEDIETLFNDHAYMCMDIDEALFKPKYRTGRSWRTNELVCVPKSPITNRTISREPVTLQWCQQGLMRALSKYFQLHPEMHISLDDQSISRRFAQKGALDGSYDTIDLSKASDTVTLALVEEAFKRTPLLEPLLLSRSSYCKITRSDGQTQVLALNKFAPMGSSTCFPIECLVFSAICELSVRTCLGRKSTSNDYVVYGDDIVIRSDCTNRVMYFLKHYNFIVNQSKSYKGQHRHKFREACGVESLDGFDITPLRLGRRLRNPLSRSAMSGPGPLSGLISCINEAQSYQYRNFRKCMAAFCSAHSPYYFLNRIGERKCANGASYPEPSFIVDDITDTNFHSKNRFNDKLFREESRVLVSVATSRSLNTRGTNLEEAAYWLSFWYSTESATTARDLLISEPIAWYGTRPPQWKWKWVSRPF